MSDQPSASTPREKSPGKSCLAVAAVFFAYLLISAILFILPTGFIGPVFAIGGFLFVVVVGFHYVVWGRWVSRLIAAEERNDEFDS